MTLPMAVLITMTTSLFDRVPDSTLAQVAESGRAYTGEVRRMALELIELRRERDVRTAAPVADPYAWLAP